VSSARAAGITWAAPRHAAVYLSQSAIDSGAATSQVKHRFSEIPRIPHVAKSDLGTKRICPTTGKKFYDLNKNPVISPYTGEVVPIAPIPPPRTRADAAARASAAAAAAEATPEPVEAEELVPLEEADAEENSGKVKAVVPESEDDIEIDETIEDDDDDDSTFIADEEEGDEDVTDIIGDVGGDEET
jgi:uncharacterized protein (TIGR02300 family)